MWKLPNLKKDFVDKSRSVMTREQKVSRSSNVKELEKHVASVFEKNDYGILANINQSYLRNLDASLRMSYIEPRFLQGLRGSNEYFSAVVGIIHATMRSHLTQFKDVFENEVVIDLQRPGWAVRRAFNYRGASLAAIEKDLDASHQAILSVLKKIDADLAKADVKDQAPIVGLQDVAGSYLELLKAMYREFEMSTRP